MEDYVLHSPPSPLQFCDMNFVWSQSACFATNVSKLPWQWFFRQFKGAWRYLATKDRHPGVNSSIFSGRLEAMYLKASIFSFDDFFAKCFRSSKSASPPRLRFCWGWGGGTTNGDDKLAEGVAEEAEDEVELSCCIASTASLAALCAALSMAFWTCKAKARLLASEMSNFSEKETSVSWSSNNGWCAMAKVRTSFNSTWERVFLKP